MKIKTCDRCSKEFIYRQSASREGKNFFCSKICRYPNGSGFEKCCVICGKKYYVTPFQSKSIYCSHRCQGDARQTGVYKTCLGCKKEFYAKNYVRDEKKFCSRKCRINGVYKICSVCGKEYYAHANYIETSRFCSNSCRFAKLKAAESILKRNPNLKWCSAGKHTFISKSVKRSSCSDCGKIDTQIRNLRSRKAKGSFTFEQWQEKINLWGSRCYLCLESFEPQKLCIEHRIPISRGGSNWIANIAPACQKCNSSKHAKTEKEYRQWKERKLTQHL